MKDKGKRILFDFLKTNLLRYIIGSIILVGTTIIASFIPKIMGQITDGLNKSSMSASSIYTQVLIMLFIVVLTFVTRFIWRYLLIGNCRSMECLLRDKLFEHLQTLPVSFYNNKKTGDLVAYAINDVQAVRFAFGFGFIAILEGVAINSISIYFMASTINPILTLFALMPVPVVIFTMFKMKNQVRKRFTKVQEAFAKISEKVQENIMGIRVIKAFAQEDDEVGNFERYSKARLDAQMKLVKVSAFMGPSSQLYFAASFMLFIIVGSEFVLGGVITLGDFVAFNTYMMMIMGPIMNVSRIVEVWQQGLASFRRLNGIFNTRNDINDIDDNGNIKDIDGDTCSEAVEAMQGRVEIRNLNFTYPGMETKTLKNINITLPEGKTLGVLGTTGCGKTTLANLLLRLYNVGDGHIFVDGMDINQIPVDVLRECIGYVPQDNFLFSTTIRRNIEFFKQDYSEEEVEEAARLSGVYENIMEFPEGFDTIVGERGVTLSGGQKQRISIARAIIKSPSILILDDSLSAVDTKTEEMILNNMKQMLSRRTGIIIAHRVSSVKHADEIVFMDRGRILERGTHTQLLELGGMYYKLYNAQTSETGSIKEEAV